MDIEAFFTSKAEAVAARNALGMRYACSQPEPVTPVDGRPWKVVVTTARSGLGVSNPDPLVVDRIVGIVLQFGGTTSQVDRSLFSEK